MKRLALAAIALTIAGTSANAHARYRHHHRHYVRHFHSAFHNALSSACQVARSMGGPCGCFASELLFGHSVRNLWLANNWLKFPRTPPAPGVAAVWPGRHVAVVTAVNHDGTVTVHDSWATHPVRMAGLVFVQPR